MSLQRLDSRLSLLQTAVDEYNKAKNEFSAKVNLLCENMIYFTSSCRTVCAVVEFSNSSLITGR